MTALTLVLIPVGGVALADPSPSGTTTSTTPPSTATPTGTPTAPPTSVGTSSESATTSPSPTSPAAATAKTTADPTPSTGATSSPSAAWTASASSSAALAQVVPDAAPLVVPPPTGNNAVITVKVGGARSTTTTVGPLAGVTLTLYDGTTAPTAPAVGIGTNTCVSDADGDCSWIIPNTQVGGVNRDRRFWVVQTGVPAPYLANSTLITGPDGGPFGPTDYRFRTGSALAAGSTYSSTSNFMIGTGNNVPTASGGIWQQTLANPTFPDKCGINVALVLDVSGSVAGSLPALKQAASTFTNSLVGTPSRVGLFTFSATAPAPGANNINRPLSPVSTQAGADLVNGWINGVSAGGTTNWDRGIFQVQQSTSAYDIAVVITDGNPTVYGNTEGPGNYTRFRETENGIFSANAVKAEGTRMIAFGVGAGIAAGAANLRAISGPTVNSDYYQTSNYAQAGAALRELALGNCSGSISVVKQVVPPSSPPGSITGAVPAGGWTFGATTSGGVTVAPASGVTAPGTGAVNFNLTFPGGTDTSPVGVVETQQNGFTLVPVGAQNAVCTRLDTNAAVPVTNSSALGFTVTAATAYPVSCTVYNRAPNPPATIVVNKQWSITDTTSGLTTTYPNGTQPSDLQAALTVNGSPLAFGTERGGFSAGDTAAIAETVTNGLRGCVLGTPTLVKAPSATNLGVPYTATLTEGSNSFVITNPVTCTTRLTLVKTVVNGNALPTAWTLTATAPNGASAGPVGTTGVTALITPDARYALAESNPDPRYLQIAAPNAVPIPGSTVSWFCNEIDANGNVIPGFSDGLNGGVRVFIGLSVRCEARNVTAALTLVKIVNNTHGGTATPANFNLTAAPQAPAIPGLDAQTVPGSTAGQTIYVRPGKTYDLSESSVPGYQQSSLTCVISSDPTVPRSITTVTLQIGESAVCTFVNVDTPGTLTLNKVVVNAHGGTATADQWSLTATGPTPLSGVGPSVTGPVSAGTYTLAETVVPGGPPAGAYSASGYVCDSTGATPVTSVVVPLGGAVSCTITNTDVPATLTLVKAVDNGTTGGMATPSQWTLTAAGPTPLSGVGPTVTGTVNAGSYALSEAVVPGGPPAGAYASPGYTCTTSGSAVVTSVAVPLGGNVTCTVVNTAQQAYLTLVKTVVNDNGGTAAATDWTLTADGPTTPISGVTGEPEVTHVAVLPGAYALGEDGPPDYTASAWTCLDGDVAVPVSDGVVSVALGINVVCTITNDDIAGTWTISKASDPASGSTVVPGQVITYTVTARKLAGVDPVNVVVADDLSGVLGNATLVAGSITSSTGSAELSGTTLTWSIPDLSGTQTVSYQVTVNAGAYGVTLTNHVTSTGSTPCVAASVDAASALAAPAQKDPFTAARLAAAAAAVAADPAVDPADCTTTTHSTPAWSLAKSSDPASGSTVPAGSTITYTLTVTNTYLVPVTGATVTDNLAEVLNHGTLVAVPAGATLSGTTLTWTVPALAAQGDTAKLTYQVTLNADAYSVIVANVATPGPGGSCTVCSTTHLTPPAPVVPPVNPPVTPLPDTGTNPAPLLWLAGLLLLLGAVAVVWSGRQRSGATVPARQQD